MKAMAKILHAPGFQESGSSPCLPIWGSSGRDRNGIPYVGGQCLEQRIHGPGRRADLQEDGRRVLARVGIRIAQQPQCVRDGLGAARDQAVCRVHALTPGEIAVPLREALRAACEEGAVHRLVVGERLRVLRQVRPPIRVAFGILRQYY